MAKVFSRKFQTAIFSSKFKFKVINKCQVLTLTRVSNKDSRSKAKSCLEFCYFQYCEISISFFVCCFSFFLFRSTYLIIHIRRTLRIQGNCQQQHKATTSCKIKVHHFFPPPSPQKNWKQPLLYLVQPPKILCVLAKCPSTSLCTPKNVLIQNKFLFPLKS